MGVWTSMVLKQHLLLFKCRHPGGQQHAFNQNNFAHFEFNGEDEDEDSDGDSYYDDDDDGYDSDGSGKEDLDPFSSGEMDFGAFMRW